jgi:hypothetical protein
MKTFSNIDESHCTVYLPNPLKISHKNESVFSDNSAAAAAWNTSHPWPKLDILFQKVPFEQSIFFLTKSYMVTSSANSTGTHRWRRCLRAKIGVAYQRLEIQNPELLKPQVNLSTKQCTL